MTAEQVKAQLRHTTTDTAEKHYTHDDVANLRAAVKGIDFRSGKGGAVTFNLTPAAVERAKADLASLGGTRGHGLRVSLRTVGDFDFRYKLVFGPRAPGDLVLEYPGLTVYVGARSVAPLENTTLDYGPYGGGDPRYRFLRG